ncbi:endonuclease V [Pseudoalteromonas luteoviolacea]|uniref:Endonuclease V n=1 Tax=Pseudoalteromonas luteoviolacea TaxID=43657 RepID=A0A1C0TMC1_9GAMM|nr:deoxyribonuclease V [Pseudoalteromonas luteoviolacea]MBQ4814336.1 deoxyribonuclease V [Pseudoalteromonas luteoviolacea]OCQ19827.1 endonuclease V [Pseudoalteromonas luteoviolacea]
MEYIHPQSPEQAQQLQHVLAEQVIKTDAFEPIKYIAGVDVAYDEVKNKVVGAVVVLDAITFEVLESQTAIEPISFPYVPGLFSFREVPPLLSAIKKLTIKPDLIVCDGQGVAHPKRCGMASHLGVLLNIPTIGCGKTKLLGEYAPPAEQKGSHSDLIDNQQCIGKVLRTQNGIKPVFVSIGHKVSLATAVEWIDKLTPKYRLPETTRQADQLVNRCLKNI